MLARSVEVSKNAIRSRATAFAKRWAGATREAADSKTFWDEFFAVFGIYRRQVATFEELARRTSTGGKGRVDLLYPGQMAVEHKSAGQSLDDAMSQLLDYLPSFHPSEFPWLLVVSDFENLRWKNLETGTEGTFILAELPSNLHIFWWMSGHGATAAEAIENQEAVSLKATGLLADLHDELEISGYGPHDLREWMTRILFCLFADDTEIWDRAAFHSYIARNTRVDGSDLGPTIAHLFQVLNTPPDDRQSNLDDDLNSFTYINGDLFARTLSIPACTEATRTALLKACTFDWSAISPAIFGSMFQNVMEPAERRQLGAHYTSERDIMRTIAPLFLDALRAELDSAKTPKRLRAFHDKLAELKFFDPACGCGNFLVVAYREIRKLETETIRRLAAKDKHLVPGQRSMSLSMLCRVNVAQFYGIELEEFPARIARTALYLIDHIANREASAEFGEHYVRFPIATSPNIIQGDALETDWADVLPPSDCSYCFGNPPFAGHRTRSKTQSDAMRAIWGDGYAKWLDYVTCWYRKAIDYTASHEVEFAFVSTSSVSQGEQVARLWQPLFDAGVNLTFAHQPFAWISEAKGKANVHVVILGFHRGAAGHRLFTYAHPKSDPVEVHAENISPYLVAGPRLAVAGRSTPLSKSMPPVRYGSLPSDGGHLIIDPSDYASVEPVTLKYVRPYLGSNEVVKGVERWCLWMPDGPAPGDLAASPFLRDRLKAVREARLRSDNPDTVALAAQPYRFFHNAQPSGPYIGIPAQVSETRRWYPVAHFGPETIASNTLYTAIDPDGFLFAVLSSSMFMVWISRIGGRLESRLRYAKSIVHNTFPLPDEVPPPIREAAILAGRKLLRARDNHPGVSLAELYSPLATPAGILEAHSRIDAAIDRLFSPRKRPWSQDDRLRVLLAAYEQSQAPHLPPNSTAS